jgi:hypothetical protein
LNQLYKKIYNFQFCGDIANVAKEYDLKLSFFATSHQKRTDIARVLRKVSKERSSFSDDELEMADEAPSRSPKHFYLPTPMGPLTSKHAEADSLRSSPKFP